MAKRMLIDATHPEETRVVVVNGTSLEQFDVETSTKKQLKGNVYLAKVVRVEPSLQAAFVDYGGNRHGFLAFSEIHPDYYQIPVADRQALLEAEAAHAEESHEEDESRGVETVGGDEAEDVSSRSRRRSVRDYKIQEVIKRRQIMLVQVAKEERGSKGAALTTYLSLAGRYCVLMPNTARGGGVSRKITSVIDRKRLKMIMQDLDVPPHMAVILRTAGQERSKAEIKRDYDYLLRIWTQIRDMTMASCAPCLIHEEGNLIKRVIRDVYTSDIEEVIVGGEEGYRSAKDFMKLLTPSHARKVQPYKDETMPLFQRYQVDAQLDAMHNPIVHLRSGGYIVINQTEALVAIDVNSGRATKERHIEETALKTNLEAADEVARQLRLRDLAGLIVIDFIDMEEGRNNAAVERRMKEALRLDRARIQVGQISPFGLLELSRQRLRPSLMETSFHTCPHCGGTGMVRSVESAAVYLLRVIEEEGVRRRSSEITVWVSTAVALYILNHKRKDLSEIESRYGFHVLLQGDDTLVSPDYRMEKVRAVSEESRQVEGSTAVETTVPVAGVPEDEEAEPKGVEQDKAGGAGTIVSEDGVAEGNGNRRRRKRRKRRRRSESGTVHDGEGSRQDNSGLGLNDSEVGDVSSAGVEEDEGNDDGAVQEVFSVDEGPAVAIPEEKGDENVVVVRRSSRRSGRRRRMKAEGGRSDILREDNVVVDVVPVLEPTEGAVVIVPVSDAAPSEDARSMTRRGRLARSVQETVRTAEDVTGTVVVSGPTGPEDSDGEALTEDAPKPARSRRRKAPQGEAVAESAPKPEKRKSGRLRKAVEVSEAPPMAEVVHLAGSIGESGLEAAKPVVVLVDEVVNVSKRRGWWSNK